MVNPSLSAPAKIVSEGDLVCGWCEKKYSTKKILKKHRDKSCPENPNRNRDLTQSKEEKAEKQNDKIISISMKHVRHDDDGGRM